MARMTSSEAKLSDADKSLFNIVWPSSDAVETGQARRRSNNVSRLKRDLKQALRRGASTAAIDASGYQALHYAVMCDQSEQALAMAKILLQHGADPNTHFPYVRETSAAATDTRCRRRRRRCRH